ncbi:hypothetical protein D7X55_10510 [Corallococcus sp. AB049A]|uniref:Lipoprotein n=1 Tax=Corallococcus interemptor TaxID=2316720 RepID=A0A3A8QLL6_9BACT|nr:MULTISPECIES: hypothetical protein [Corallococcus]RKH46160.1 hypothetical protein D7Y23_24290 [Corallococcus sp. AB050B]RKH69636.1 hypothetical protein D7X96_14355 [Corallococcus interemptor]RKI69978.1 hypothetical protein D7X55_10510 [Corallococcus sp. AB049A]
MRGRVRTLVMAAAVGVLAGCTPTTAGPMVMRMGPGLPQENFFQLGLRAGPRLNAPQLSERGENGTFHGDAKPFHNDQWGIDIDGSVTVPVSDRLSWHVGLQGEFVGLPVPGYGVYSGVSYYAGSERLGLAPALSVRGASDFGLGETDSTSSLFGVEATCAFTVQPEPGMSLGLVPFISVNQSLVNPGSQVTTYFYGAVVAAQLKFGGTRTKLELSGGFGRAHSGDTHWNAPVVGARGGR